MPWGDGPGRLPSMRPVDGTTLVRFAAIARVHHLVGADELNEGMAREAWHDFADLMHDVANSAAELGPADRVALAAQLDAAIAALKAAAAEVLAGMAGMAGQILYVAVIPRGYDRGLRFLFVAG